MIDINLLPSRNLLSQKERYLRGYLSLLVIGLGLILLSALGLLYSATGILNFRQNSLNVKKASLITDLQNYSQVASDLRVITEKISGIKLIKNSTTDYPKIIEGITEFVGNDAKIQSLSVDKAGKVSMSLTAADLTRLGSLLDRLSTPQFLEQYDKVIIPGLSQRKDNSFLTSVSFDVKSFKKP